MDNKGNMINKIFIDGNYVMGGKEKKKYCSAGIIPYSCDEGHEGKIHILLAKMKGRNLWTYFGGHKETNDGDNPRKTAIREAHEESYDIVKLKKHLPLDKEINGDGIINEKLRYGKFTIIPKYSKSKKSWNNIYFVKIDMSSWIKYHKGSNYKFIEGRVKDNEVEELAWFSLSEFFDLVKKRRIAKFIIQPVIRFSANNK